MAGLSFVTFLRVLLLLFLLFVTENSAGSSGGIVYMREQLIALCKPALLPGDRPAVPQEETPGLQGWNQTEGEKEKTQTSSPSDYNGKREVFGE